MHRGYGHGRTQVSRWPCASQGGRPRKQPNLPTAPSQTPSLRRGEKHASGVSAAICKPQLLGVLCWARSPCPRPAAAARRPPRSVCLLSGFLPAPAPSRTRWLPPPLPFSFSRGNNSRWRRWWLGSSVPDRRQPPREARSSLAPPPPPPPRGGCYHELSACRGEGSHSQPLAEAERMRLALLGHRLWSQVMAKTPGPVGRGTWKREPCTWQTLTLP